MDKHKSFSELRKDFLRNNKERRKKIAAKEGFDSPELYLQYLENMQKSEIGNFREKAKKATKSLKETTKKPIVHLVDILDASGSMAPSKIKHALLGINKALTELSEDIDYTYTFVRFSNYRDIQIQYFMENKIPKNIYSIVGGYTALYDAVGKTLEKLKKSVKSGEKVLVNIYTDGGENDSRDYTSTEVRNLINDMKEYCTTTFIGTAVDVKDVTKNLDIDVSNTLSYNGTAEGLMDSMTINSLSRQTYYKSVSKGEDVSKNFYKKLKED